MSTHVRVCVCVCTLDLHRFFFATGPWHRRDLHERYRKARRKFDPSLWSGHTFAPLTRYPYRNDAFHTIMQWLYARIPDLSQRYKRQHGDKQKDSNAPATSTSKST